MEIVLSVPRLDAVDIWGGPHPPHHGGNRTVETGLKWSKQSADREWSTSSKKGPTTVIFHSSFCSSPPLKVGLCNCTFIIILSHSAFFYTTNHRRYNLLESEFTLTQSGRSWKNGETKTTEACHHHHHHHQCGRKREETLINCCSLLPRGVLNFARKWKETRRRINP